MNVRLSSLAVGCLLAMPVACKQRIAPESGVLAAPTSGGSGAQNEFYQHIDQELMPYWMDETAFGVDSDMAVRGDGVNGGRYDFPTWRCNNGQPFTYYGKRNPAANRQNCLEMTAHYYNSNEESDEQRRALTWATFPGAIDSWIKVFLQNGAHEYVRMRARQVFGYCVAFNITGKQNYLDACVGGAKQMMAENFVEDRQYGFTSKGVLGKVPAPSGETPANARAFFEKYQGQEWYKVMRGITAEDLRGMGEPASTQPGFVRQFFFNPQDQAYAVQGLAMYYQVTRDPAAAQVLIKLQKSIFKNFYQGDTMYQYLPSDTYTRTAAVQLVDHLDQMNAYMLLGAKALRNPRDPAAMRASDEWIKHLVNLSEKIFGTFYKTFASTGGTGSQMYGYNVPRDARQPIAPSARDASAIQAARDANRPTVSLFLGNSKATEITSGTLTDFGHSIKTMWMINMIGKLAEDVGTGDLKQRGTRLRAITKAQAFNLIREAYNKDGSGTWCDGYKRWNGNTNDERYDCNKTWWMQDELDQTTLHFALEALADNKADDASIRVGDAASMNPENMSADQLFEGYVKPSFAWYRQNLIDHQNSVKGGFHQYNTWNLGRPQVNPYYPKAHLWRNAYHESEHAIVGYTATETMRNPGHNLTMYYAYNGDYPYAYFYKAAGRTQASGAGNGITRVTFNNGVR